MLASVHLGLELSLHLLSHPPGLCVPLLCVLLFFDPGVLEDVWGNVPKLLSLPLQEFLAWVDAGGCCELAPWG